MTDLIVSGIVYALTLIGLVFLVKGNERKLLSIGSR
jgi:hypothetical protein